MSELESGGNIKFLPGDPSHSWYRSCVELLMSRFSASETQVCGRVLEWSCVCGYVGDAPPTTGPGDYRVTDGGSEEGGE